MDVTELVIKGLVVGIFQENCWILGSRRTGEAIVVDPGDEHERIIELARDLGVAPAVRRGFVAARPADPVARASPRFHQIMNS